MTKLTHVQLQEQVGQLLGMMGWRYLHVRKSIGKGRKWQTTTNIVGWPDLAPCWSTRQPGRILAIELKVPPDFVQPDQQKCIDELTAAGLECYVITEADLDELARILRPRHLSASPNG